MNQVKRGLLDAGWAHDFEIRYSRNQLPVPVVRGVPLHSLYDPIREAAILLEFHQTALRRERHWLVCGLGFGYHVDQAITLLQEIHGERFAIAIVEPNPSTVRQYRSLHASLHPAVTIFCKDQPEEHYSDRTLISFLLQSPCILEHPATVTLYRDYFHSFFHFKAARSLSAILPFLSDPGIRDLLSRAPDDFTLEQFLSNAFFGKKGAMDPSEFLLAAFSQLVAVPAGALLSER